MKIVKAFGPNLAFSALASAFIATFSLVLWKPAPAPAAWAGAALELGATLPLGGAVQQDTAQAKEDDEEKKGLPSSRPARFASPRTAGRGCRWM